MISDQRSTHRSAALGRVKRLVAPLGVFGLTLVLSACASDAPQDGFTPGSELGPIPRAINRVAHPTFIIAVVIGVLLYIGVLFVVIKFRRKGDDDTVPVQVHGNKAVEIASVSLASLLLIGVGIPATATYFDTTREPDDAYEITVIGHQWWWEYRYAAEGDKLTTTYPRQEFKDPDNPDRFIFGIPKDDRPVMVNANELHIPEGRDIRLAITSMDVLHNYWVPKLSGKIYAIPGKVNYLNLKADVGLAKPGKPYFIYGQCAEFCGTSHANMRFKVVVQTQADFDAWKANQMSPALAAKAPTKNADDTDNLASLSAQEQLVYKGEQLFKGSGNCVSCHYLEPDKGWNPTVDALKIGPNLAHVGSRAHFAGAIAPMDEKNLTAWLRNPQEFKPGSKMVIRNLKDDEVEALVAYIKSLK